MAQQSLYRRYRPRRFGEVRGQDHVVEPLRNAVSNGSAGQAYLFSGPRGTGKTTTARILAKALNCENPTDGEPCCECVACIDMQEGRSFDLFELDAASNNGVDAIRDLIERAAVGSPGRTKVYILDEVHMLSTGASNALLKTLEEPPDHVRFVLATTDPHKVLPTIRSRTQHFDFQLLPADELESQVREIVADAGLDVGEEGIAWAVQQGRGSSRDTLSALDKVAAAGGVVRQSAPVDSLFGALAAADPGVAMQAVAEAAASGHDPRVLASSFVDSLRDAFMVSFGAATPHLVATERSRSEEWATTLGTPLLTRAMETVGSAIVDMRNAPDPRVPLEVALIQLTSATPSATAEAPAGGAPAGRAASADIAALVERVDRLERALAAGRTVDAPGPGAEASDTGSRSTSGTPAPAAPPAPSSPDSGHAEHPPGDDVGDVSAADTGSGPAAARAELARLRSEREGVAPPKSAAKPAPAPPSTPAAGGPPVPGAPPRPPRPSAPAAPPTPPGQPQRAPEPPAEHPAPPSGAPAVDEPSATASASGPAAAGAAQGDTAAPNDAAPPAAGVLTAEHVANALTESVVPDMKGVAKAIYGAATVEAVDGDTVTLGLQSGALERGEKSRTEVEAALARQLGRPVKVSLLLAAGSGGDPRGSRGGPGSTGADSDPLPEEGDDDVPLDVSDLEDATDVAASGVDRLTQAFPGAQVLDHDEVTP